MTGAALPVAAWRPRIVGNLSRWRRMPAPADPGAVGLRHAAVSVCLVDRGREAHVVVIKRVARGRHPGQWALPGGRLEPSETAARAAARELAEEVAIAAEPAGVVGALDDFVSAAGFVITPFVVLAGAGAVPRRNPDEVHSVHLIPVRRLLDPALPRWRPVPGGGRLLQMPLRRGMVVHAPTGA
ncbi:MAG TPA: NUDIX domain-containing protein, partial [Pilimelia sp.]|nr:NUDIX domain-containing protein [Pilimelia sp.]